MPLGAGLCLLRLVGAECNIHAFAPLELKRALMQICEKMRNEYWLNASFTVENLLIGCMNGQYQPENKLNEITVRNYGFTVEDSCGMFILWFGEDFEKK